MNLPTAPGCVYRHTRTGKLYIIVSVAKNANNNFASDGRERRVIIYRAHGLTGGVGELYARDEDEFHEMLRWQVDEEGDRFEDRPRFQLVEHSR